MKCHRMLVLGNLARSKYFLMLVFLSSLTLAQDSLNVRFTGGYPFGQNIYPYYYPTVFPVIRTGVINDHKYVFNASGSGIMILNADDPASLQRASNITSPAKMYPVCIDTLLYATLYKRGLKIYSIANPSSPIEIGNYASDVEYWSLYVLDSFAYAVGRHQLTIFNVADPANLHVIGVWTPTPSDAELMYIYVHGNYAYITAERPFPNFEGVLFVIDVSDPVNPYLTGTVGDLSNVRRIQVKDNLAYVTATNLFYIIDISSPSDPFLLYTYTSDDYFNDVALSGNYAFFTTYFRGLQVIDVSNPSFPFLISSVYEDGALALTLFDNTVYMVSFYGVQVFDVAEPQIPFKTGEFIMLPEIMRVKIFNNHAIVSTCMSSSLGSINVTDPLDCYQEDTAHVEYYYDGWLPEIDVQGNYAYVTAKEKGLRIYDISDSFNIYEVGYCIVPGQPGWPNACVRKVFVDGDYAYLAAGENHEFAVVDISTPSAPQLIGGIPYNDTFSVGDISVVGDYAYCATSRGLKVIDVSDPYHPQGIGQCSLTPASYDNIFVSGRYAFLGGWSANLTVIDIVDPYHPFFVIQYDLYVGCLFVQDDYLFVGSSTWGEGLKIFDVSYLPNFQQVGYYKASRYITGIDVAGDKIYLATYDGGLWILQSYGLGVSERQATDIGGNDKFKIASMSRNLEFSYYLKQKSLVKMLLIDVCGRKIKNLTDERLAGHNTQEIECRDMSAGVYFLRVETDEWKITKKIVLLK